MYDLQNGANRSEIHVLDHNLIDVETPQLQLSVNKQTENIFVGYWFRAVRYRVTESNSELPWSRYLDDRASYKAAGNNFSAGHAPQLF